MKRENFNQRLKNAETIVIKVGSARLSGSNKEINDFLFSLVSDIRELRESGKKVILVSSGAIAQGRKLIHEFDGIKGSSTSTQAKQALAALGQSRLMNLYEGIFSRANIPIAQILFGTLDLEVGKGYDNLENTFKQLLTWNVLPIVNENDSIATEELKLGDNDILSALVTLLVAGDLLVVLTGVDGFLKSGKKVNYMDKVTDIDLTEAKGPEGPGTGGMNTKLKAAKILLEAGVPTVILNGKEPHIIKTLFSENKAGTLLANSEKKKMSTKEIKRLFGLK
ncbi:MAG: glutamate 5-kinase [Spirochaetia bacterium]|nr:glutamate 5-kinase [Spirochaetia bacterium]